VSLSSHFAAAIAAPNRFRHTGAEMGARYNASYKAAAVGGVAVLTAASPAYALGAGGVAGIDFGGVARIDFGSITAVASQAANALISGIQNGHRAAPALMVGLSVLLAIPLMVFSARVYAWWQTGPEVTRRYRRRPAMLTPDVSPYVCDDIAAEAVTLPGHAFVEIVGARPVEVSILRDMLRIGREDDNDIRMPVHGVHRYHAAIHRQDFGDYRITDLSGLDGNGIVVNGQRCSDARLADGDMIELGPGKLRFHAGLM
jgi:FHA domain